MSQQVSARQLLNLVPLIDLEAGVRDALLPHARLLDLKPGEWLARDPAQLWLYLVRGSVRPGGVGASERYAAPADAAPADAITPLAACDQLRAGTGGARLIAIDPGRIHIAAVWKALGEADPTRVYPRPWLDALLKSQTLARLPAEHIEAALLGAEVRQVPAGTELVQQGAPEDEFFLVIDGTFTVHRETDAGMTLVLAELGAGDSFGEEALLAHTVRNASVEADSDAIVFVIDGDAFGRLFAEPLVRRLHPAAAREALALGATCLDVREADEFARGSVPGARNAPLLTLRDVRETLQRRHYIVICDDGRRSTAATFLLRAWGHDACMVDGGLPALQRALEGDDDDGGDPPLLARTGDDTALDTLNHQMALADEALEAAMLEQQPDAELDGDPTDPGLAARIQSATEHLQAARDEQAEVEARIQAARERMDSPVLESLRRLEQETEQRLGHERERLRIEYDRAVSRITDLRARKEKVRAEAEARIQAIRDAMLREQQRLDGEAAVVHQALLGTRQEALAREAAIRAEHARHEATLAEEGERLTRAERDRLESEFARSLARVQVAETRLEALQLERREGKRRGGGQATQVLAERRESLQRQIAQARISSAAQAPRERRRSLHDEVHSLLDEEMQALIDDEVQAMLDTGGGDSAPGGAARRTDTTAVAPPAPAAQPAPASSEEMSTESLLDEVQRQLGAGGERDAIATYVDQIEHLSAGARAAIESQRRSEAAAMGRARAHLERLRGKHTDDAED